DLTFTINAGSGPSITTQPASQTVCEGGNASFSVVSSGTYQWQLSTDGGSNWSNISGATSTSYSITGVTTALNGNQYRCIVSGQCGSTTSNAATLTVNVPPAITADPAGLSLCSGSGAMFSVTATGSGLTYQWQISTDGGSNYSNIPGETASTYSIAATTTGENGNMYRCVVTGSCPPSVTSAAALLSVSSDITITGNPTNKTICEGTNTSFAAAASGTGLSYQWQVSTNGGGSWTDVSNGGVYSGATTNTLSLTGVTPSMNTYQYRCVVSNPPCNPGTTTAASLTVNTFPQITAQPQSATICESQGNTFSVVATTGIGSLTYQWQVSTNGGSSWINLTGATSSSYSVSLATAGASGYQYRVIVTAGCGSVTSNAATLTVNTYPVITLGSIPTVVCVSDASITLSGSPAGGAFSGAGVSGSTFSPSAAGIGAATITYTATNAGCVSTQNRVIQVNECAERHLRLDQYPAVVLYPNPTDGQFRVKLNTDLYSQVGIQIYDSQGRIVQQKAFSGLGYGSIISMDMSVHSGGVYHVMVYSTQNGYSSKTFKVVLER
ncbi:MAG TPA: T9SS type A sorting domain-containing protein, partial [Chitinophagaceae bacterium]|nr:T9SS type A sorting domain-containing protein [Chitinophagaceae bacterium]